MVSVGYGLGWLWAVLSSAVLDTGCDFLGHGVAMGWAGFGLDMDSAGLAIGWP